MAYIITEKPLSEYLETKLENNFENNLPIGALPAFTNLKDVEAFLEEANNEKLHLSEVELSGSQYEVDNKFDYEMISQKYSKPFYEKDGELHSLGVDDYIDPQDKTVRLLNMLDYEQMYKDGITSIWINGEHIPELMAFDKKAIIVLDKENVNLIKEEELSLGELKERAEAERTGIKESPSLFDLDGRYAQISKKADSLEKEMSKFEEIRKQIHKKDSSKIDRVDAYLMESLQRKLIPEYDALRKDAALLVADYRYQGRNDDRETYELNSDKYRMLEKTLAEKVRACAVNVMGNDNVYELEREGKLKDRPGIFIPLKAMFFRQVRKLASRDKLISIVEDVSKAIRDQEIDAVFDRSTRNTLSFDAEYEQNARALSECRKSLVDDFLVIKDKRNPDLSSYSKAELEELDKIATLFAQRAQMTEIKMYRSMLEKDGNKYYVSAKQTEKGLEISIRNADAEEKFHEDNYSIKHARVSGRRDVSEVKFIVNYDNQICIKSVSFGFDAGDVSLKTSVGRWLWSLKGKILSMAYNAEIDFNKAIIEGVGKVEGPQYDASLGIYEQNLNRMDVELPDNKLKHFYNLYGQFGVLNSKLNTNIFDPSIETNAKLIKTGFKAKTENLDASMDVNIGNVDLIVGVNQIKAAGHTVNAKGKINDYEATIKSPEIDYMTGAIKDPSISLKIKEPSVKITDDSAKISAYGQSLSMGPDGVTNSFWQGLEKIKDSKTPLEVVRNAAKAINDVENGVDKLPDEVKEYNFR